MAEVSEWDDEYIQRLETVVKEAKRLRVEFNYNDHFCFTTCQKCKTLESFDRALAELDKFKGK